MDSDRVETRVIGGARLTGRACLLDMIRTATEADLTAGPATDGAQAAVVACARDLVPPQLARWLREGDAPPSPAAAAL